jgi:hypothetical protein
MAYLIGLHDDEDEENDVPSLVEDIHLTVSVTPATDAYIV